MGSSSRSAACGALVAGVLVAVQPVTAAELSYGAYLGLGYTDNVTRVSEGKQDETIATIGGQLSLDHESRRLDANVASRLEYREYLDGSYDSEVIGNLIGHAMLDLIEERFTWTLDDTFGQATQNQFAPTTPDNRENVNNLSTGPDFTLPLGSRNKMILRGRYVDVKYEDSDLGNQRTRGEFALRREISEASSMSLNATTEEVTFDDDTQFAEYDHDEGYLSYDVEAARTTLSIDGGVTQIRSGGETDDSWLGRLEFTRQVSPALAVGIKLGHDFSDAGAAFANLQDDQPGSIDPVPVQQTASPFENTYGTIFGQFNRNRTALQLRLSYYDEQYDSQPELDRTRQTLDLSLSRDLNASLSAHASAYFSRQDFETLDHEFTDLMAVLGLRWNFGRVSFLSFDYQFYDRNDDTAGDDYSASEVWVRLSYLVGEGVSSGAFNGP